MLVITIPGDPVPKARHRLAKRGKFTVMYDPQEKRKQIVRKQINWQIQKALDSDDKEIVKKASNIALGESFDVKATFYMPIPKNCSLSQKKRKFWGLINHTSKPDIDNLAKFYLDCCNKVLYNDDAQIVRGSFCKKYSDNPRTEIKIMAIEKFVDPEVLDILSIYGPLELQSLCNEVNQLIFIMDEMESPPHLENIPEAKELVENLKRLASTHAKLLDQVNKKSQKYKAV